jgi:hypothetical protein
MPKKNKDKEVKNKNIEKVESKPEDEKQLNVEKAIPKQKPDLPKVPLNIYCNLSGKKFDQIAGFRSYAKSEKMGPMTIPQWKEKFIEFQKTPMR